MFDPSAIGTWIFVTGMIRSGTTFLGTALSLPRAVDYLHEPFNGGVSLPERRPFEARYVRPGAAGPEAQAYRDHLAHIFRYRLSLPTTRHPRDSRWRRLVKSVVGSRGPVHLALARANPFHRAAVLKDPTGKLVAEYLSLEFGVRPVIVVRHPVSLAASLQRVGWWPEMHDFTDQPDLVEDYFADEAAFLERRWPSPLLEAMAHWRATHKVLLAQARAHPDWIVLTHEALSRKPVPVLRRLYADLGLPWSPGVERKVRAMTGGRNTAEASGNQAMDLNRDAASIFEMRRDAVAPADRRAIFEVVQDVALELYSEDSFALPAAPAPAPHSP
jgi:hypothetical protein